MKKFLLIIILHLIAVVFTFAQDVNVIPYPTSVKKLSGSLRLNHNVIFHNPKPAFAGIISYINSHLNKNNAHLDKEQAGKKNAVYLSMVISRSLSPKFDYMLNTTGRFITITSRNDEGLFHGMITLLQMIQTGDNVSEGIVLPHVVISDQSRFAWRGFMLDESRHFFGKAEVEKLLDWMAYYKFNRFHWHLTDVDGWRIEIKQYPLLTSANGNNDSLKISSSKQYYTQEEIKDIVKYATDRHITIIPEIDMPGHATAAVQAYPELSGGKVEGYEDFTFNPGKETTYTFLTNVLKEVVSLFPSRMVHTGGDEVAFGIKAWENNSDVAALMRKEHLPNIQEVERYFTRRMADSLATFSKRIVCWDEAVQTGLDNKRTMINWWRHNKPQALSDAITAGYKVVLCPRLPLYFDFVQDSTHLSGRRWDGKFCSAWDVYHFPESSPDSKLFQTPNIIGLQGNLWTETVISVKRLHYLIFPRLAALAEASWTPAVQKDEKSFKQRLLTHLSVYEQYGVYYYDPYSPKHHPEPIDVIPVVAKPD